MVYVDGFLVTGNNLVVVNDIKALLHQEFTLKYLGDLKYFLGSEVFKNSDGIQLIKEST